MSEMKSHDPRTGKVLETVASHTTRAQLDEVGARAGTAFKDIRLRSRSWRAELLLSVADALESRRREIVEIADRETALGVARLNGELTRTTTQLRHFSEVVLEGSYLEAIIDHAQDTPTGPMPDVRRMLVPLGPVAVFGASNFPLAFSVPGGDTASALAAGCPVIAKVHESHPSTSRLCAEVMSAAATAYGAPPGTIQLVYGREAGGWLVQHPTVQAVSFTGSQGAARVLMDLIAERTVPIPFFGELGSVNPVIVTPGAALERADEIGVGLAQSVTLGVGQFCTKPGLVFVPSGPGGDRLVDATAQALMQAPAGTLLNSGIATSFAAGLEKLLRSDGVVERATGRSPADGVGAVSAHLLEVHLTRLGGEMLEECFGPVSITVRYDDIRAVVDTLASLPASLTGTIHLGSDGLGDPELLDVLLERSGRVIFDGFPTGVAVCWAQNHGGGWPATNSQHTSVGATAIRRFLRPVAWQGAPTAVLPTELRDATAGLVRRVDGVLQLT